MHSCGQYKFVFKKNDMVWGSPVLQGLRDLVGLDPCSIQGHASVTL